MISPMNMANPHLSVTDLVCEHPPHRVVDELSFSLAPGEIGCLLGPSGCGKTTTLRAIAGLQRLQSGEINLANRQLSGQRLHVAPEKRGLGMVFQEYALFPHMTVAKNIDFGLRGRAINKQQRVGDMLALVGLSGMGDRYPEALSGGQQQRVALARALAPNPQVLLLDEPFSNLDVELRERLSNEVHEILKSASVTALLVTHEQQEAFAMADKVGVMQAGRIVQWDTPYNVYHQPATRFVADFIGKGRFLRGEVVSAHEINTSIGRLRTREALTGQAVAGQPVDVLLRPDDVVFNPTGELQAQVVKRAFKGAEILYTLKLESGDEVLSLFPSHENHAEGDTVRVSTDTEHVIAFAA